jgi:predicted ester cyclase
MNQQEKNKQFFFRYMNNMRKAQQIGPEELRKTMNTYIKDEKLIRHITFFKKAFPKYDVEIIDIMAEGNKLFVRINFIGKHVGEVDNIPVTNKEVEVPFALCYTIEDEMIVDFWALANEMEFFEQLGMSKEQVEVPKS